MNNLNDMQLLAAKTVDGPVLILAGAGSGKTTVLVNRIAYMIEHGIAPYSILAITFTNKAANELKLRIAKIVPDNSDDIWASTFHSMCVRILRRDIDKLGYDRSFVIYDTSDMKTVIKDAMKAYEIDTKMIPINSVIREISNAKNEMMEPEDFEKLYAADFRMSKISKIYTRYQETLRKNNALDFDDLIWYTVKLFQKSPDTLKFYQNKFKYIMVDEYQDTNNMQYMLISLLAMNHHNLCVVGDDDQSIYKFRGANIKNILDFEKQFPEAKVIRLEQNYRSTKTILDAANGIIANNKKRKGKNLWTAGDKGDAITVCETQNEHEEAKYIAKEIDRLVSEQNCNFSDFALLYRTNAQSRILEEMLLRQGLPYRVLAGLRFYDRKEIKDMISYLRIIVNPNDSVSLKRIINEPKRGIGASTIEKAELISIQEGSGLFDVICRAGQYTELSRAYAKLSDFTNTVFAMKNAAESLPLSDLCDKVLELSGYRAMLQAENSIESQTRIENIEELQSAINDYVNTAEEPTLQGFLEEVSLVSDIDNYDEEQSCVVLMTIHAAKGLEFETVFICGCEEGLFPGSSAIFEPEELEEERRLCYVAVTRAKKNLYMTYADSRMLFGQTKYSMPSRFLDEIPAECITRIGSKRRRTNDDFSASGDFSSSSFGYSYTDKPKTYTSETNAKKDFSAVSKSGLFDMFDVRKQTNQKAQTDFKPGDRVEHKKFGAGTVLNVIPLGNDSKIEIEFDSGDKRNLMALFANLIKL